MQQPVTPVFDLSEGERGATRGIAVCAQLATDLAGIEVAHQSTDVLAMPTQRLAAGHPLTLDQRFVEFGRETEAAQPVRLESEQGLAQCLQVEGIAFASCLAGRTEVSGHAGMILAHTRRVSTPEPDQETPILSEHGFSLGADQLGDLARHALDTATRLGASAAEVDIGLGQGLDVTVRLGEVETLEYARDRGLAITVWLGQRRGHASTSDISTSAIAETVAAALAIARHTGEDAFTGLPEPDMLAWEPADLDLCHPWPLEAEAAVRLACEMEAAAMAVDARIENSDGASVSTHINRFVYANSLGFCRGYDSSRHSLYCSVIAGEGDGMQRDDWYAAARAVDLLDAPGAVGRRAGERTVARLGARKLPTCEVPVLFEAAIAVSLIGHWAGAVSGGNLYRGSSFLLESVGRPVWAPCISIEEVPDLPRGLGSAPFDAEGVLPRRRILVDAGVQQGYFLSTYSARKLGLRSTGNAGGPHNLMVRPSDADFEALLREMGRGLLVTELMGQGVNLVTGDYSRGASGFWVEGGRIVHPVEEVTIAGNLRDIFRGIVAVGSDVLVRGGRQCPSLLVDRMTVAGS